MHEAVSAVLSSLPPWTDDRRPAPVSATWLSRLGVLGWPEADQRALLVALAARVPVLLVGAHGTAKTQMVRAVAEAMDLRFHAYAADKVQLDDLIGFLDPRAMMDGELSYLRTGACLWDKEFVLLDELGRAMPSTQSKFLEVLWDHTLLGERTDVQHVWAAMNPAAGEAYHANPPDHALLSRFCLLLKPPTLEEVTEEQAVAIVGSWATREQATHEDAYAPVRRWLSATVPAIQRLARVLVGHESERWSRYLVTLRRLLAAQAPEDVARLDARTFDVLHKALVHLAALVQLERADDVEDVKEKNLRARVGTFVERAFPLLRLREGRVTPLPVRHAHEVAWEAACRAETAAPAEVLQAELQSAPLGRAVDAVLDARVTLDEEATGAFVHRLDCALADVDAEPETLAEALGLLQRLLAHVCQRRWPASFVARLQQLEERFLRLRLGPVYELTAALQLSPAAISSDRALTVAAAFMAGQHLDPDQESGRKGPSGAYLQALHRLAADRDVARPRFDRLVGALRAGGVS